MKGYENVDVSMQQSLLEANKSHTTCKLTELAEIALGTEKTNLTTNHNAKVETIDLPKNNNESSTSSKTIMHSSILNAVVDVQNTNNAAHKIIIPERPFKNIGLEEKEGITFQKPRTSSLSLLKRTEEHTVEAVGILPRTENSISSASFSDRDDFDFGSLSCGDDEEKKAVGEDDSSNRGVKTPSNSNGQAANNIPLGISESSNNSNRSDVTVKNFENKSLIMGRIFKNNTTKVPSLKVKSVGVQKDPLPAKADLNQLFDELRGEVKPKTVTASTGTNTSPTVVAATTTPNVAQINTTEHQLKDTKIVADKQKKNKIVKEKVKVTANGAGTENASVRKPKGKVGRKPKTKQVTKKKDINKLQNELGLSPKQIEQLIDEGQRKSKRRCAAISNKKLVETWSSDEYEEFLSTKDVIALIEEKEKQEQEKRKRKSNSNIQSSNTEEPNGKSIEDLVAAQQQQPQQQSNIFAPITDTKLNGKQVEINNFATPALITPTAQKTKENKKIKCKTQQETLWNHAKDSKEKLTGTGKKRKHKHSLNNELGSNILAAESYIMPNNYNEMIGSANRPLFLAEQTPLMHSSHSAFASTTSTHVDAAAAHCIVEKKHKSHKKKKEHKEHKQHKKKIYIDNGDNLAVMHLLPETQPAKPLKHRGRKRKLEGKSKSKHSRRKRERKYYWSSSSSSSTSTSTSDSEDEHEQQSEETVDKEEETKNYGINGARTNEVFVGSEHLQKHGWIVGDSHKKLVTLLAIAKGSKSSKKSDKKRKNSKRKNIN